MPTVEMEIPTREEYERMASEYMASLPLEHYMEGNFSFIQRLITYSSFNFLKTLRSDFQICGELLVQYPLPDGTTGQVVPDSMIVLQEEPIGHVLSFNTAYQRTPLMVMEYVSKGTKNQRKDYVANRHRYESELKVPYYLIFDPYAKKLAVLHLEDSGTYVDVDQSKDNRFPIFELDIEIGLLGGWVRFWHEGKLLPIESEAQEKIEDLEATVNELEATLVLEREEKLFEKQRADEATRRAEDAKQAQEAEARKAAILADKLRTLGIDPGV